MSTVEKETGETLKNEQESSHTIKQEVLSGDERSCVEQERSFKRKKKESVTLKRKKKKSDGEKVAEVGPTISKEGKTFNWRSYQWQTAINEMNSKIVTVLTPYKKNSVCNGQEEDTIQGDRPHHRVSHKKIESGFVQLPSLDVPSAWILNSSHVER